MNTLDTKFKNIIMEDRNYKASNIRIGILIGLLIFLIVFIIEFLVKQLPFTIDNYLFLHKQNPGFWLVDALPLILGLVGYFIGYRFWADLSGIKKALNDQKENINKFIKFIGNLTEGKTDFEYNVEGDDDVLGKAVVNLRDTLKKTQEEDTVRRKEDKQRSWTAEGLAKFGDILRDNNDNLNTLSEIVLSELVKYLEANQGGFFVLEEPDDGDKYFDMKAAFAYDRQKFAEKTIQWGEGLVGMCALEKDIVFMSDVPNDYVHITSGLGEANPKSILLVPLKVNEEVHGVIEVASFKVFEQYQIDFVEKVAEIIASTLSSMKINIRTAHLLEDSRKQQDRMQQQEEQMRQNMEEMRATQEEAQRREAEMAGILQAVDNTVIKAELTPDGKIINCNKKFLRILEFSEKEIVDQNIRKTISLDELDVFEKYWNSVLDGRDIEEVIKHKTAIGNPLYFLSSFTPVENADGRLMKVLFMANDMTKQKEVEFEAKKKSDALEQREREARENMKLMEEAQAEMKIKEVEMSGILQAIDNTVMKAEFNIESTLINANEKYLDTLGYSLDEIKGQDISMFISSEELEAYNKTWEQVVRGKSYSGIVKALNKKGRDVWLLMSYTPVKDVSGKVQKVLYLANDITEQKKVEIKAKDQAKILRTQEEKLRLSQVELERKLKEAKEEMRKQFKEIEGVKVRNEMTLEGMLDAIITFDSSGIVQFFNKAAEELWGFGKEDVLGDYVSTLFSEETAQNDEFVKAMLSPDMEKIVGERKEVNIKTSYDSEEPVLMLLSDAEVDGVHTYTAFIQKIEVELF